MVVAVSIYGDGDLVFLKLDVDLDGADIIKVMLRVEEEGISLSLHASFLVFQIFFLFPLLPPATQVAALR